MSAPTTKPVAAPPWTGATSDGVARLDINGDTTEIPLVVGTEGERALDISRLRATTGTITLDEGYVNTGSTTSAITYLDGEQGILRYRGYPIEDLAAKADYVEVAYLLIYGELPTTTELDTFRSSLSLHTMIHAGCPSDGDRGQRGRRALHLLPRFARRP
jgi:citrate synthase